MQRDVGTAEHTAPAGRAPTTRLRELAREDQEDRRRQVPPGQLSERDTARRAEVYAILDQVPDLTPEALGLVALVLHHGADARDALLAHLAAGAAIIGGQASAGSLLGPTFDRLLHRLGLPQALGTQVISGTLCIVRDGRVRSVEPAAAVVDVSAEPYAGQLAEGSVVLFGQAGPTTNPIRDDIPSAIHHAYGQHLSAPAPEPRG